MWRIVPEVRALCERARRPILMLTISLALMMPGGLVMLRGGLVPSPALAAMTGASGARPAAVREGAVEASAATVAWRVKALERQREELVAKLAEAHRAYRVPLSLAQQIHDVAVEEDIDPEVAFGLVRVESGFRRTAVSSVGAVGLTQVLPSTARWLVPGTTRSDLLDTRTNLRVGFRYLRYLIDKYDGNIRLALTAYNRGPGRVDGLLRRGRDPDNGYAAKVLRGIDDSELEARSAE